MHNNYLPGGSQHSRVVAESRNTVLGCIRCNRSLELCFSTSMPPCIIEINVCMW